MSRTRVAVVAALSFCALTLTGFTNATHGDSGRGSVQAGDSAWSSVHVDDSGWGSVHMDDSGWGSVHMDDSGWGRSLTAASPRV
jgi:hypothetical protein